MAALRYPAEYPNQSFGLRTDDSGDLCIYSQDGTLALTIKTDGTLIVPPLPTIDPAVKGALYQSSGTVKISL